MWAEQAVFASADSQHRKGYQLVARSDGIDTPIAQELCRWAPSHGALVNPQPRAWSLSYFPADERHVAVARTTHGGAEYSGRGGMEVVTAFLVVPVDDFARYDNDPVALARTALALGYLRLPDASNEYRSAVRIPDRPVPIPDPFDRTPGVDPSGCGDEPGSRSGETLDLVRQHRRVVVLGEPDPLAAVHRLMGRLAPEARLGLTFATGLTWSMQREFRLQFLPTADPGLRQRLFAQKINCVLA